MNNRLDRLSAVLIQAVIRNYDRQNIAYAARVLAKNGVPFETALRVLTKPWLRRQSHTGPRGCWRDAPQLESRLDPRQS